MKKYYFYDGIAQQGPITLEELQTKNITAQTLVWFDPMPQWKPAGEMEELKSLFNSTAVPPPLPPATAPASAPTDTITISRPAYELNYPSGWIPDTEDKDFDLDGYFAIDGPVEDATSIFFIYNVPIDEKTHIATQVKIHLERVIKNGDVSYFDNWGNFKGHGAIIKGKMMGVFKGETKIFCHSGKNCSFVSFMQYLDSDREIVLPGFQLIESSFRLKQ
ncbi:MAG TPA: DUF4339 domain-containing protein [Chitinophagaceae bacterium]|nr:DUF4339 domain-containing protein [Chitinophagaceae bacterium]